MKFLNYLVFLIVLLISVKMTSCQNMSAKGPGYDFALFSNSPVSFLAKAVNSEDTSEIVRLVIKDHVPIDYRESRFGSSLLMLAVLNNKKNSILKLLQLGANPNLRAYDDSSPFLKAMYFSHTDTSTLEILIKYNADVNSIQNDTSLDQFGKKKKYHNTALGIASLYGNLETIKILLDYGAKMEGMEMRNHLFPIRF